MSKNKATSDQPGKREGSAVEDATFDESGVDDKDADSGEPAAENTGSFAGGSSTLNLTIGAGDILWYRHLEDGSGGLSGIIINPVPEPTAMSLLGLAAMICLIRRRA